MANSPWIIDVDESNFVSEVLDRSHETPVLVDFWAPWCGPCRSLGPVLEKLAAEMAGRFILAKVNSDQNPMLSRQFGVQGIPACKLVIEGGIADEFTGALPESQVRQFLDRAIPSEADGLSEQAALHEEMGHLDHALTLYQAALEVDLQHRPAMLGQARVLLALGRRDDAARVLEHLDPASRETPEAKALLARMAFQDVDGTPESLQARVAAQPDDLAARMSLGRALVAREAYQEGLEQFLEVVQRDRGFEEDGGRKAILQVFEMLGHKHPLVARFRPRLSALLFS